MPQPYPWFERTYTFDVPAEKYPDILERLRGTPARVEELVRDLPDETLRRRDGDTWSILENIGHLIDLEELFTGRLDDFLAGDAHLRAADVTNQKTHDADHNSRDAAELLADFRRTRMELISRLEALDTAGFAMCAHHPRLDQPMRLVDSCIFHADHDDYHLARISQLIRHFAEQPVSA